MKSDSMVETCDTRKVLLYATRFTAHSSNKIAHGHHWVYTVQALPHGRRKVGHLHNTPKEKTQTENIPRHDAHQVSVLQRPTPSVHRSLLRPVVEDLDPRPLQLTIVWTKKLTALSPQRDIQVEKKKARFDCSWVSRWYGQPARPLDHS